MSSMTSQINYISQTWKTVWGPSQLSSLWGKLRPWDWWRLKEGSSWMQGTKNQRSIIETPFFGMHLKTGTELRRQLYMTSDFTCDDVWHHRTVCCIKESASQEIIFVTTPLTQWRKWRHYTRKVTSLCQWRHKIRSVTSLTENKGTWMTARMMSPLPATVKKQKAKVTSQDPFRDVTVSE